MGKLSVKGLCVSVMFFVLLSTATQSFAAKWYEGGTLHKSNISEWKSSTQKNKLATAGDWVISTPSIKKLVQKSNNIDTGKPFAEELVVCIDTATEGIPLNSGTADIAVSCIVLMGWL